VPPHAFFFFPQEPLIKEVLAYLVPPRGITSPEVSLSPGGQDHLAIDLVHVGKGKRQRSGTTHDLACDTPRRKTGEWITDATY